MDERYRLIFRGEILEGQHRAVVKRRLTESLKLEDAQVEKLFSGKPVVLKKNVDRATAVRYQALFKKAGGQLRVKAESSEGAAAAPVTDDGASSAGDQTPDFKVQAAYFPPPQEPRAEIQAPDFSVATLGSDLVDRTEPPPPEVPDVDFELAEVGADLLIERPETAPVEVGPLDFEVAEVGADIGPPSGSDDVRPPDVSHIALADA